MSIILTDEQNQLWLEAHEKYVMDQASIQEELRLKHEAAAKAEEKAAKAEEKAIRAEEKAARAEEKAFKAEEKAFKAEEKASQAAEEVAKVRRRKKTVGCRKNCSSCRRNSTSTNTFEAEYNSILHRARNLVFHTDGQNYGQSHSRLAFRLIVYSISSDHSSHWLMQMVVSGRSVHSLHLSPTNLL